MDALPITPALQYSESNYKHQPNQPNQLNQLSHPILPNQPINSNQLINQGLFFFRQDNAECAALIRSAGDGDVSPMSMGNRPCKT